MNKEKKKQDGNCEDRIDLSLTDDGFDTVMLMDDDGAERPFRVVATLKLDEVDYALLTDDEDFEETGEIMVFRLVEREGELVFEGVEDDDEIDSVLLAANELFEEEVFEEE
ncbi:MAG: DUF1292 domain-containing protein [Bacillota bacterium]|nr:DUF1292 domain-containing protein [Bacillota bacterium]